MTRLFWWVGIQRNPGCPYPLQIGLGLVTLWRCDFPAGRRWEWSWNRD